MKDDWGGKPDEEELRLDDEKIAQRKQKLQEASLGVLKMTALEREMLNYLLERPAGTWCLGCDRVLDALHAKATTPTI